MKNLLILSIYSLSPINRLLTKHIPILTCIPIIILPYRLSLLLLLINFFELYSIGFVEIHCRMELRVLTNRLDSFY